MTGRQFFHMCERLLGNGIHNCMVPVVKNSIQNTVLVYNNVLIWWRPRDRAGCKPHSTGPTGNLLGNPVFSSRKSCVIILVCHEEYSICLFILRMINGDYDEYNLVASSYETEYTYKTILGYQPRAKQTNNKRTCLDFATNHNDHATCRAMVLSQSKQVKRTRVGWNKSNRLRPWTKSEIKA